MYIEQGLYQGWYGFCYDPDKVKKKSVDCVSDWYYALEKEGGECCVKKGRFYFYSYWDSAECRTQCAEKCPKQTADECKSLCGESLKQTSLFAAALGPSGAEHTYGC